MIQLLHLAPPIGGDKGGGVAVVVRDIMTFQKFEEFDINLWFPGSRNYSIELKRYEKFCNRVKLLRLLSEGRDSHSISIFQTLKILKSKDIIHQHSIWTPVSLISLLFTSLLKGKVIIQPHGALAPKALLRSSFKKRIVKFLYENRNFEKASLFVANSLIEVKDIKRLYPQKEVALIPNGVSTDFFYHPYVSSEKYDSLFGSKDIILFLSRIHPIKGIERMIEAVGKIDKSKIQNYLFVIAGSGEESYINFLKKLIIQHAVEKYFKFIGYVEKEEKIALLDRCKCFVLPSYTESFSVSIVEAMARGVPVITTQGTPWEELNTAKCGYWIENSVSGIELGLNSFLDLLNHEQRKCGERAKKLVLSKYIIEDNMSKYEDLYKYVLGNHAGKPSFIV